MHRSNKLFLSDLRKKYPMSFNGAKVLELGSGTTGELVIRKYFKKCKYVGVDLVGKKEGVFGVDVLSEASHTKFKKNYFDTLVCFSMFEHDPTWKESLSHNIQFLKPGAKIFISFGCEGNRRHDPEPWRQVKAKEYIQFCSKLPIDIVDAFFEEERYGYNCEGVFDFVAEKAAGNKKSKFDVKSIKPVPKRPPFRLFADDLLYLMNRSRRNLRSVTNFQKKYFYSQSD